MFRAAAVGPYDEAVAKATDENLTSEDWGAIIEVCDKVSGDANGPKEAVQSLMKRLAHRNANVQLYTLELAHALCQNCGKPMHREISSRAFTDALLKLVNDRNTHAQVKAKILEKMKGWSEMFGDDVELGIMADAYHRLKQSNPTLQPPSAPQKQGLTDADRQKEEDELQMALKLSLQEEERKKSAGSGSGSGSQTTPGATSSELPLVTPTALPAGTTAATVSRVRALYDFVPSEPGELDFKRGDVIAVLESVYKDWWRGSLKGKTGIFPLNYVEKLTDPTPDELQREAQMEAEVFAEIKNVEKLLTLLSTSNTAPREEDNEEISKLYHQTLAIRPKLIKLIEKYSQKKDDFTQLNEKFIKARRDYEALLESSMSHPPQHNYHQYALRPAPGPGSGYHSAPGSGYPAQGQQTGVLPSRDAQGFYGSGQPTASSLEAAQYQNTTSSTSGFQPHGTPAPFYMAGSEVPAQTSGSHQYGPREPSPRVSSQGAPPPQPPPAAAIETSPPPGHNYGPFGLSTGQANNSGAYPQNTYGAQELATSAYDQPPMLSHKASLGSQQPAASFGRDEPVAPYSPQPSYHGYNPPDQPPPPPPPQQQRHQQGSHGGFSPPPTTTESQYQPYVPPAESDAAGVSHGADDYYRQGATNPY